MPPIQKNSVVPKTKASKVWRHFGDNRDGASAKCLLCLAEGDAHKSLLVDKYSSSQVHGHGHGHGLYEKVICLDCLI